MTNDPYVGRHQPDPVYRQESTPAPPDNWYPPGQYAQPSAGQGYPGGQPYYPDQQQYPDDQRNGQENWDRQQPPPRRRKKRRVFLWIFLALQVLFVIWIITAAATKTGPTTAQIAAGCYNHQWYPLFKSQADCVTHFGGALNDAGNAGKGVAIALIVALWVALDVILGISYGVYRLATRNR